jgi:hypothetical protein
MLIDMTGAVVKEKRDESIDLINSLLTILASRGTLGTVDVKKNSLEHLKCVSVTAKHEVSEAKVVVEREVGSSYSTMASPFLTEVHGGKTVYGHVVVSENTVHPGKTKKGEVAEPLIKG